MRGGFLKDTLLCGCVSVTHDAEHLCSTGFAGAGHRLTNLTALTLHLNLLSVHHLLVFCLTLYAVSCYVCHSIV